MADISDAVVLTGFESGIDGAPVATEPTRGSAWSQMAGVGSGNDPDSAKVGSYFLRWTGDCRPDNGDPYAKFIPQRFVFNTTIPGGIERQDLRIFAECRITPGSGPVQNNSAHYGRIGIEVVKAGEVVETLFGAFEELAPAYPNAKGYWRQTSLVQVIQPCDAIRVFVEVQGGATATIDWDDVKYLLSPYVDWGTPGSDPPPGTTVEPVTGVVVPPTAASRAAIRNKLPHIREQFVDGSGKPTQSFYTWAAAVDRIVPDAVAAAEAAKAAVQQIPRQLGSPDGTVGKIPSVRGTTLTATLSVSANASGSGYTVQLVNDAASPEPTSYYGTDSTGAKGWQPVYAAFEEGEGITFDTDADTGVTTISANAGIPYYIPTGTTYTVPEYQQALYTLPIDCDGLLVVDGALVEVN
mgnify:CR=1 FL=1